jgi:hypothetical protein
LGVSLGLVFEVGWLGYAWAANSPIINNPRTTNFNSPTGHGGIIMSGSSRSSSIAIFTGLRVANTEFTPEHSKNGKNYSAKLAITAYQNIASNANGGKGRNERIQLTLWGKRAHSAAKSMSPGKEIHCHSGIKVFDKKVFKKSMVEGQPGVQVMNDDGTPVIVELNSYTISYMTYGDESDTQIAKEIAAKNPDGSPVRPADWKVFGSAGEATWKATLEGRKAIQFDPTAARYGFARIRMPYGEFSAYNPALENNARTVDTTQAVAQTFTGNAAANTTTVEKPAVVANAGGFVVPGV